MGMRIRLYGMERMRRERMIGEIIIGFALLNLDVIFIYWIILEFRSNLSVRFLFIFIKNSMVNFYEMFFIILLWNS